MFPDLYNTFCEEFDLSPATATPELTDSIKLGTPASGNNGYRFGAPSRDNMVMVTVTTAYVAASTDGTIVFDLISSALADGSSPNGPHGTTPAIAEADLGIGAQFFIQLEPFGTYLEHLFLRATAATQNFSAGSVTARLVPKSEVPDDAVIYASGLNYKA